MTQYLVSDLINSIQGKMHDQTTNKLVGNIYDKIDDAVRNILMFVDLKEAKRYVPLETALYADVNRYLCPNDINGDRVLTIRPISNAYIANKFRKTSEEEVVLGKEDYTFAVNYDSGAKFLQINRDVTTQMELLNEMDSLTLNGAVSISGDTSELAEDTTNFVSSEASVRFKMNTGGTSGILDVDGFQAVDLTAYSDEGAVFALVDLPSINTGTTPITSITLRVGQDISNYREVTVTRPHDSNRFRAGLNMVRFDLRKATNVVGSPTYTGTDYLRLIFTAATPLPEAIYINVDQITVRKGTSYELGYYSINLFKDYTTGELKDKPTADNDIVLLEKDSINLIIYETMEIIAQEMQGEDSVVDLKYFQGKNKAIRDQYKLKYPSETKKKTTFYYRK